MCPVSSSYGLPATAQVFRLSAPSKAGLPKALLNTEGSVGVDVNELYFKYQRLLNKENGCFSISLSVLIVNSCLAIQSLLGDTAAPLSCGSTSPCQFQVTVRPTVAETWGICVWSCVFLCSCSGA